MRLVELTSREGTTESPLTAAQYRVGAHAVCALILGCPPILLAVTYQGGRPMTSLVAIEEFFDRVTEARLAYLQRDTTSAHLC